MRIAALVESEAHVCCRYRLSAFRASFANAGYALELHQLPRGWFGRLSLGRGLEDADAVIVQRKLLPRWALALLRRRVRRLIFDFDDAVWLRDSYSPRGFNDPRRLSRFRAMVAACDLVVAGNSYLAAEARKYATAAGVIVIPTCVDPAKYPTGALLPHKYGTGAPHSLRASREQLQLVWVGSSSTLRGLKEFVPTLSAIGRALPGTRLKLVCDRFFSIPNLPVDECKWREDTEVAEIAAAGVGIGWVPDDPWSRGKCGLKLLQYHAAGLPVVANPVGVQAEIVRDGATGLLATTTHEWTTAIARLAADAELRARLGSAGRKQVEVKYSLAVGARAWLVGLTALLTNSLPQAG